MQLTTSSSRSSDQLAAKILAAAVCMRYPSAQILEAKEESYGFCVEFYSSELCSEALFPFLEEGMHEILSQKDIQTFEMTSSNAVDFLRFHHQKKRAQILKEWSYGLVFTVKIGSYVDFFEKELDRVKALEELGTFKLIELKTFIEKGFNGEQRVLYRIKGVSAFQTRLLKEIVKKIKEAKNSFHLQSKNLLIQAEGDEGSVVWLPDGLTKKNKLLKGLCDYLKEKNYQELEGSKEVIESLYTQLQARSIPAFFALYQEDTYSGERDLGLYSLKESISLLGVRFCLKEKLTETYTQVLKLLFNLTEKFEWSLFIEKQSKKQTVRLEQPPSEIKAEEILKIFVKDSFEREWEVARIEIGEKKNPCYVKLSLISIERWFALLFDGSKSAKLSGFQRELFEHKE